MFHLMRKSPLFSGMTDAEIQSCLKCSGSEIVSYEKDQIIFFQQDIPSKLYVLLEGSVAVCSDSVCGRRNILATFSRPGELFGEVFLFLDKKTYENYAQAATSAKVLQMPKQFLYQNCVKSCGYHTKLISNMLSILSKKAYYLNQKLQIISGSTLRQKIARVLIQNAAVDGTVTLGMNREELADFLNVARPSLSRELMKMKEEGMIRISGKKISIVDQNGLQDLL
ncbi:MAG: Crp/Fnr family transcriptional regulator [Christensenellales bacterium]|jgi:CRP-like cAMP-binding protein